MSESNFPKLGFDPLNIALVHLLCDSLIRREQGTGNREQERGKRQEARGKRQKARGKRQEAKGKRQKLEVESREKTLN